MDNEDVIRRITEHLIAVGMRPETTQNVLSRIQFSDGCWNWSPPLNLYGYGRFSIRRRQYASHRVVFEAIKGPIPRGLTLDHLCRNRACVNPGHLEPVTNKENLLRGESFSAVNSRKSHCLRGHELSGSNIKPYRGRRSCVACRRAFFHARYLKIKSSLAVGACAAIFFLNISCCGVLRHFDGVSYAPWWKQATTRASDAESN